MEPYLSAKTLGTALGISSTRIDELVRRNKIPSYLLAGTVRRFRRSEVEEALALALALAPEPEPGPAAAEQSEALTLEAARARLAAASERLYELRERLETGEYDDADGRYYLARALERLEAELAAAA